MKKFNLKKMASKIPQAVDKSLEENRNSMEKGIEAQSVVDKNINSSLPTKNVDNTVPFNKQLEAVRKNETEFAITEAGMDKKEISFGDETNGISPINALAEDLHQEKLKAYTKAEKDTRGDTDFWDKYVGLQMEEEKTTVSKNIPSSASQLQNHPDRFSGKEEGKMVMASVKDADAMIFHIYATAEKEGREVTKDEEQQIIDITSGKIRALGKIDFFADKKEFSPVLTKNEKTGMVEVVDSGSVIDEFSSYKEALENYPEAE